MTEDVFFFETAGFSMWPFLKGGQKLIVKRAALQDLNIGDIILYRNEKQLVCHRLIRKIRHNRTFVLLARGDNSGFKPEVVNEDMFQGKAVGIAGDSKIISLIGYRQKVINKIIVIIAPFVSMMVRIINTTYHPE